MKELVQQAEGEEKQVRRPGGRLVWKFAVFDAPAPEAGKPDEPRRMGSPEGSGPRGDQEHRTR